MSFDVVVVGAGPAGLCFALSLAGSGGASRWLSAKPRRRWAIRPTTTVKSPSPIVPAGCWVNSGCGTGCTPGAGVTSTRRDHGGVQVVLDNGQTLHAGLLVGADSRFSETRRHAGISASMLDFGQTMLVCRMRHAMPHAQTAWEWFGFGQTLALLPLHDAHTSSVVVTLDPQQIQTLLALDDAQLGAHLRTRFQGRLGDMSVSGPRCAYPLVGVYAHHFVAERFALIGDAAVGMHPDTAHGFNFGLLGQATLACQLLAAHTAGRPIWDPRVLRHYARVHRRDTLPLYLATQVLANLYTDDRGPARVVRKIALFAGAHMRPFRRMVMSRLTQAGGMTPTV